MTPAPALAQPRWLRPALVGLVIAQVGLALVIDARLSEREHAAWEARLGAVLLLGLLWLLELAGPRLPRPVFALAVAAPVAWLNAVRDGAISILFLPLVVAWVTYTGSERAGRAALAIALLATLSYLENTDPEGWLSMSVGVALTWLAVRGLRRQQALLAELRVAQADLARQAQAAERRRIAREIHDVAAHTLAVTMLQLTGVRLLLQRSGGDPRAIQALDEAERLGRQGLDDVRRTVGLLADGADAGSSAPLPGGSDLEQLATQYRQVGLEVAMETHGDPGRLPAGVGLALYRIAQEALANVAEHAPGARVQVELEVGASARLRVRNGAARPGAPVVRSEGGSGLGLAGMRERAELLGGTLSTGRDGDGWVVDCSVPLRAGNGTAAEPAR
jgi:signal transduction histidine kinase